MPRPGLRSVLYTTAVLIALVTIAAAKDNTERFQMNHDIRVEANERVGEVTCINCSVHVRGNVAGDVTTINGNIVVEEGGSIAGDIATIHGDVRLDDGSRVGGDIATIVGAVRRASTATVGGDVASLGGAGWMIAIFLAPLLILGGIIALIVWLVQRSRRPARALA